MEKNSPRSRGLLACGSEFTILYRKLRLDFYKKVTFGQSFESNNVLKEVLFM